VRLAADAVAQTFRDASDMNDVAVDFDALIGRWRTAFDAAEDAVRAARRDTSLRGTTPVNLDEEREETVRLLDGLARDRHAKRALVRVVLPRWRTRQLLGVPSDVDACVFNLDGVLIGSAALHAAAWRETFDAFLSLRADRLRRDFVAFDPLRDYRRHIHGRPRLEGVLEFLASLGISLPLGSPADRPGTETVHGLANAKRQALLQRLREQGVSAFEGARLYLELVHDAGIHVGVVSASANAASMLEQAQLTSFVEHRVDGDTMAAERLRRKPAADTLLAACRHLHVVPERTAVFETTPDGVVAGRAGGFEVVVGVARGSEAGALRAKGADLVVADLGEILEQRLAA
jgi:HAD superfamily hydrolase (TIGR01509 family)